LGEASAGSLHYENRTAEGTQRRSSRNAFNAFPDKPDEMVRAGTKLRSVGAYLTDL
jgi:hypothetical protein